MTEPERLFDIEPKYCFDTNVFVSFLAETDNEYYGVDVFQPQWQRIERLITNGEIVAPGQIEVELGNSATKLPKVGPWLKAHGFMFRAVETDSQLGWASRIVNEYKAYGKDENSLGDLEVLALAADLGLTVVTLEQSASTPGLRTPKIPDVCSRFGIRCTSVSGFLRRLLVEATPP